MQSLEFTQWLVTLGVGGILAGFMFVFYRKDVKQYTELWKSTSEMLITAMKDNTAAMTKLVILIESMERNHFRKDDIKDFVDRRINEHKSGVV